MRLKDENGVAYGVKQADGKPRVSSMPYLYDISEGAITGHTPFFKLGANLDVDNTEEDVWTQGGKYVFPTSPIQMRINAGGNAQDSAAGTGIQQVIIYYLDTNYASKTEIITLNGANAVNTAATNILRVNAMRAYRVGTNKVAAATINLTNLAGAVVYRSIATGYTRGRSLVYTVPSGKNLFITSINLGAGAAAVGHYAQFTLRANYDDQLAAKVDWMSPIFEIMVQDTTVHVPFDMPTKIPEKCDIVLSVISDAVNADVRTFAGLRGWLETT